MVLIVGAALIGVSMRIVIMLNEIVGKHIIRYSQFLKSRQPIKLAGNFNNFPGGFEESMSVLEAKFVLNVGYFNWFTFQ